MLTSGTDFDYVLGNNASAMYASVANINQYFGVGNLRLYLSFSPMVVLASRKSLGNGMKYLILVMWIAFPVIGSFFLNAVTNPYEFNMIFPVNFLIIGILFDYALKRISSSATSSDPKIKRASNLGKLVAITLLVSIIAAQVTFDAGFFNCLNVHEGTNGDYGVGWQYKAEAASYIAKNTVGNNFTISYPNDIGIEYYYLLSLYN